MTRVTPRIDRVFADKRLIGAALDMTTRQTWNAVLKAAYAIPLDDAERDIFSTVAGGRKPPTQRVRELWINAGRRSDKSEMAGGLIVYEALFVKHRLSRGETGMVLAIAGSRDQAKIVFNYVKGILEASPVLAKEIANVTADEITLKNGIVIAVHTNSFRTVRGRTVVAAIFDEVSFWRDEASANPDQEVYRAVMPAMATTQGLLIGISSPYRRLGLLYSKYRDFYGVDSDDVLVVKGSTQTFNPTLDANEIATQRAADPAGAASEWDAEFRDDLATYLDDHLIDAAIEYGRPLELPPQPTGYYKAFTDASGGAVGGDLYALCIGHKENGLFIIDCVRGVKGPFDPYLVTTGYAALLKQYRISTVTGDRYGKEWVAAAWRGTGIAYVPSPLPKSDIYLECIPLFSRGLVRLPDHQPLLRELRLLQLQRRAGGKESVDHPKGDHDDYANVVCGVLRGLSNHLGYDTQYRAWCDPPPPPSSQTSSADARLAEFYRSLAGPSKPAPVQWPAPAPDKPIWPWIA